MNCKQHVQSSAKHLTAKGKKFLDTFFAIAYAKLHEKAKGMPEELLEIILGDRMYLVRQRVRDVSKPTITQKVQLRTIAPSAPSLDVVGTWTELYYAIHEPRPLRPPEHLPGYVPDGLQALVS